MNCNIKKENFCVEFWDVTNFFWFKMLYKIFVFPTYNSGLHLCQSRITTIIRMVAIMRYICIGVNLKVTGWTNGPMTDQHKERKLILHDCIDNNKAYEKRCFLASSVYKIKTVLQYFWTRQYIFGILFVWISLTFAMTNLLLYCRAKLMLRYRTKLWMGFLECLAIKNRLKSQ